MRRTYLYVSPEEYAEVKALGACWDEDLKNWYIPEDIAAASFTRWLEGEERVGEFGVASDEAWVASAWMPCSQCRETIEVICVYCDGGKDLLTGELLAQFTLSNVWGMDGALAGQLKPWRFFKKGVEAELGDSCFTNYCPYCNAVQEDYLLHDEPGDVFFAIPQAEIGAVEFTPLVGRVALSGNYSFLV